MKPKFQPVIAAGKRSDLVHRFEDLHRDPARMQLQRCRQASDPGANHESAHHPLLDPAIAAAAISAIARRRFLVRT